MKLNNNIATTETAKPIHEARVTVIPSAKTSPDHGEQQQHAGQTSLLS